MAANIVLFVSQASWVLLFFIIEHNIPLFFSSFDRLLLLWILGGIMACCYGALKIKRMYPDIDEVPPIDWRWIKSGLSVCYFFFFPAWAIRSLNIPIAILLN